VENQGRYMKPSNAALSSSRAFQLHFSDQREENYKLYAGVPMLKSTEDAIVLNITMI